MLLHHKGENYDAQARRIATLTKQVELMTHRMETELKAIPETPDIADLMRRLSMPVDGVYVYDQTFTGITTGTIAKVIGPTGTTTAPSQKAEFMPGATYYWHVRNGRYGPMYSPWTETRSFTVETAVGLDIPRPAI